MNLTDFLSEYNVPVKLKGEHHHTTSDFIQVDCPFCSPGSGHYLMGLAFAGRGCSCWRCGRHSTAEALHLLTSVSYAVLRDLMGDWPSLQQREQPPGKLVLPKGLGPLLPAHVRYLRGRGFDSDELVKLWGLQGIGVAAKLPWRIFIPVHLDGDVVSWTTRSLTEKGRRYHSATPEEESVPHRSILFGSDYCRHAIIICEGPFDVFRIGPGAVATMGLSYTRPQLRRMSGYARRVVCFDNELGAQTRARQLCRELSCLPGVTTNVQIDAADPGGASPREVRLLRKLLG